MQAKLSAVKQLTGSDAELVFVPTAEEGLALVAVNIHRFGLLLVSVIASWIVASNNSDMCVCHRSTSTC